MAGALKLTRNQLASFLKDPEQIKQFERLVSLVSVNLDSGLVAGIDDTFGNVLAATQANAASIQALSDIMERAPKPAVAISGGAGDLVGNLPVERLNGGFNASIITYWRGDGVWAGDPTSPVFTYTAGLLTRIDYAEGSYKDLIYTAGVLTRVDYVQGAVTIRKDLMYTAGQLTSITQTVF